MESILRGTTNKWITLTRRGMLARQQQGERGATDDSNTIEESAEENVVEEKKPDLSGRIKVS